MVWVNLLRGACLALSVSRSSQVVSAISVTRKRSNLTNELDYIQKLSMRLAEEYGLQVSVSNTEHSITVRLSRPAPAQQAKRTARRSPLAWVVCLLFGSR